MLQIIIDVEPEEYSMDVAKTLNKNPNLKRLFNEIDQWKKIRFEKSQDGFWGAHQDGDMAVITYASSSDKVSCLAHELLHFKVQKDGYRRLRVIATSYSEKKLAKSLLNALDNELQHHKMFPMFKEMGFLSEKFYNDSDTKTAEYLDMILSQSCKASHTCILLYLNVIALGGSLSRKQINSYKHKFRTTFQDLVNFNQIDSAIKLWVESSGYCSEQCVREIFRTLEDPTCTWFGYDDGDGFPDSGFFIDEPCTMEEIASSLKSNSIR